MNAGRGRPSGGPGPGPTSGALPLGAATISCLTPTWR